MLRSRTIDVVVPVCGRHAELVACVEAVRQHGGNIRLIIVDDCPDDARIGKLFGRLSTPRAPRVHLLRNERELGFAASANRGIAAGRNDVVVLGADALVTRGWLDRIRRCAASDPSVGTVTPLSNDAGVCFVASGDEGKSAPSDPELVNRAAAEAAVPLYPDAPAATPLCMFIRRGALRAIGAFDETFANGEDAVRDLSVRARKAGYRNVLCDDTFVGRGGAASAGVQTARDPIEPIRGMIRSQVALLSHPGKPGVLHVLHDRGGGTEKYVRDLVAQTRESHRHFYFRILPDHWRLTDASGSVPTNYEHLRHDDGTHGEWLGSLCAWLGIERVHVHSLVGSGDDLLRILDAAGLPYCYTVHDMYLPCPTVYLIDSHGDYCEATTDVAACRRCLSGFRAWEGVDIERWRLHYRDFLARADRVFAPSAWARDTLRKYFPGVEADVAPPRAAMRKILPPRSLVNGYPLADDGSRHVGVLGAIGPEKGARILEMLVTRVRERGLPLRVVLIGYTDRDNRSQSDDGVFTVHGRYRAEEITALLDHYRIAVVLFPTVWPETFSYTLGETWLAGRPALVPPAGALQERVIATGAGWIMDGWPNVDAILDQMTELTAPENRAELTRRGQLAQAASREGEAALDPVREFYGDMRAGANRGAGHVVSRQRIYESACLALGIEPAAAPTPRASLARSRGRAGRESLFRLFRG